MHIKPLILSYFRPISSSDRIVPAGLRPRRAAVKVFEIIKTD